jgi:dTDP-glucose 4,6-dehydratase
MRVLVTGGAGFVGSNFIHYALAKHPDWEITNLDKLTYAGNIESLRDLKEEPRYRFVKGDIADAQLVDAVVAEDIELIINFAAETHVDRSYIEPARFVETNVRGGFALLEAARKHGVERFVQISTPEVYGGSAPTKRPFIEDDAFRPNNPYAASKACTDLLCRAYFMSYGLPVVSTRFANAYGPYQYPEKLLPLTITNALRDKPIPLYGDGRYRRNWIHVHDICRAIDMIIERGRDGETYNIPSGYEMANVDLVRKVLRLMRKPEELIVFVPDRPSHDWQYPLNADKIEREIGWKLEIDLERGLAETIEWYQQNRWWWEKFEPTDFGELFGSIKSKKNRRE